jgi:hypothetical protein
MNSGQFLRNIILIMMKDMFGIRLSPFQGSLFHFAFDTGQLPCAIAQALSGQEQTVKDLLKSFSLFTPLKQFLIVFWLTQKMLK